MSISVINGNSITNSFDYLYWIIDVLPACIMLCDYFSRKSFDIYKFFNTILIVGTFQGISAVGAFLVPNIQQYFIKKLILYGYGDIYSTLSAFRMFGFASNLTFSTPVVQSLLAVVAIYLAINKNWKYIFFSPLLFFSAIINARTSLIILLIGFVAIIINSRKIDNKVLYRVLIISAIIALSINLVLPFLENNSYETYKWIITGYNEITSIFEQNQKTGTYFSYILNTERYILPKGFEILFGVGIRIMSNNKYGVSSDIGYVNDIWIGGIFYASILYIIFISFLRCILVANNTSRQFNKFMFTLFTGTFIVCNVKGYIFSMNNFTNLFLLVFSFMVLRKESINYSKIN